jgi:hypothetical protein
MDGWMDGWMDGGITLFKGQLATFLKCTNSKKRKSAKFSKPSKESIEKFRKQEID